MPVPYSNDLCKRIIDSKLKGIPESQIAAAKDVHKGTVTKLWTLYRKIGSYEPRPNSNGRKPILSAEQLENVKNTIIERPDITLRELLEKHSLPIGISGLCKIIKKLGFRYKKNSIPQRATAKRCENQTRKVYGETTQNESQKIGIS